VGLEQAKYGGQETAGVTAAADQGDEEAKPHTIIWVSNRGAAEAKIGAEEIPYYQTDHVIACLLFFTSI